MFLIDKTFDLIDQGKKGLLPKVSFGIPKLDEYLFGIRQGYSYLIGGDTGTGKSNFIRSVFIDNVYEQTLRVNDTSKLDALFIDFTLEIPPELNIAATLTRKIFTDHKKVIPTSKLFSWTTELLTEEDFNLISTYKKYVESLDKKSLIIDRETSPNLFHDVLMDVAKKIGKFATEGRYIDDCKDYVLDNPNLYVFVLFDTLNLAALDSGHTSIKSSMDRISKIAVRFRNKCNFIFVGAQQFNSDVATVDRSRFGVQGPVLKDFMDSTNPAKDSTVVLGLYSPMRYLKDDQLVWRGYDVGILQSWLISAHILKNRYGQSQKFAALKFDGAVGLFTQLPPAVQMTPLEYELATRH